MLWVYDLTDKNNLALSLTAFLKENDIAIHSFVHCAGVSKICPFRDTPKQYFKEIFDVNFFSAVEIMQLLLKRANKKALQNIVLFSSASSIRADKGNAAYAASKGAINSLVATLASELAPTVRINAIAPGTVETPMSAAFIEKNKDNLTKTIPLGIGKAEDIAYYVEFLLSEKAKWITGQTFIIDGGMTITGI